MDPLLQTGAVRLEVVCSLCKRPWDTRIVRLDERTGEAPAAEPDEQISLCPSCLLATSHGQDLPDRSPEPYPDDPQA